MEAHSRAPAAARRMWVYLRAVFMMARKGLLANKRKLLLGAHLLMKRRNKALARTVANLLSHNHGHGQYSSNALRRREYEFSCSGGDSPAAAAFSPPVEYCYYAASPALTSSSSPGLQLHEQQLATREAEEYYCVGAQSPALVGGGGFSVRVSNYSAEDNEGGGGGNEEVDDEAEEFIRRFYEQLRRQNTVAMLPYYLQESAAA